MLNCSCENNNNCTLTSITISVIIGIIAAFLRYFAVIAPTTAFYWVLFGIAVVYPAVLLLSSSMRGSYEGLCVCSVLPTLITGIAGTIITSLVLLGITFAATSIIGAIITGLLLAFFSLMIANILCLIICKSGCRGGRES